MGWTLRTRCSTTRGCSNFQSRWSWSIARYQVSISREWINGTSGKDWKTQRERACLAAIVATLNGPLNPSVLALEIPVPDTVSHIRVRDLIIRPRLSTVLPPKRSPLFSTDFLSPSCFMESRGYICIQSIVNTTFRLRNSRVEYTGYTDLEIPDWRLNYGTMLR